MFYFFISRAVLILLWALLIAGVIKVSQFEKDYNEYNPYDVLRLDPVRIILLRIVLSFFPLRFFGNIVC